MIKKAVAIATALALISLGVLYWWSELEDFPPYGRIVDVLSVVSKQQWSSLISMIGGAFIPIPLGFWLLWKAFKGSNKFT